MKENTYSMFAQYIYDFDKENISFFDWLRNTEIAETERGKVMKYEYVSVPAGVYGKASFSGNIGNIPANIHFYEGFDGEEICCLNVYIK